MRTIIILLIILVSGCTSVIRKEDHQILEVLHTPESITIDGYGEDSSWKSVPWKNLDHSWKGGVPSNDDLSGRYKMLWEDSGLVLLVEVKDDSIFHYPGDPLKLWWMEDLLMIYLDEDNSGGLHQYNDNAFAYHITAEGNVIDLGPDRKPLLYDDHLEIARRINAGSIFWEVKINLYKEGSQVERDSEAVPLQRTKKIGFALGYADNDGKGVSNVIGSVHIPGENKDLGWINADIFGTLVLVD